MYYYSPSKKGFYVKGIHKTVPEDIMPITKETWNELRGKDIDIGPSGGPEIKPSPYHTLKQDGSDWEILPANQILKDDHDLEGERLLGIKLERDNSGLRKVTIEQAYNFIDSKLDSASSAAEVKEAIRDIFKKMIPHILD